jgi:hypothetical protein
MAKRHNKQGERASLRHAGAFSVKRDLLQGKRDPLQGKRDLLILAYLRHA